MKYQNRVFKSYKYSQKLERNVIIGKFESFWLAILLEIDKDAFSTLSNVWGLTYLREVDDLKPLTFNIMDSSLIFCKVQDP